MLGWSAALDHRWSPPGRRAGRRPGRALDRDAPRPRYGRRVTPLGRLYGWIALAVFLALDGPLILVGALVESYEAVPAGGLLISHETAKLAFAQVGHALELALRAAAPPALALALAGIVLGWLSRAAPSLPFVALALPIRCSSELSWFCSAWPPLVATLSTAWGTFPGLVKPYPGW